MRRGDLVPFVLIGGIIAFIAAQGVKMRGKPGARVPAAQSESSTPPSIEPQGTSPPSAAASTRQSARDPLEGMVEMRLSSQPPPVRDSEAIRALIRENAPGTYLLDVLQQHEQLLMRWPARELNALRVWIDREPDATGWESSYSLVAERVFDEWREAGFPVAFTMVLDSAGSDIRISWVSRFPESSGRRIGRTNTTRDQHGWMTAAEISIALHDRTGERLPASLVAGITRHEVGHALGLGHSGNPADVMYPESRTSVISAADRATLHLLYRLPPGVVK